MSTGLIVYAVISFLLFLVLIPKDRATDSTPTWKIALISLAGGPIIWTIGLVFLLASHGYDVYKSIRRK